MTVTDFYSLTPFLILAMAPIIIMIVISIYRNYEVVFGFSVLSIIAAIASIFYILPVIPHSIPPLFIIDKYSLFFLGIIMFSALLVTFLSYDYLSNWKVYVKNIILFFLLLHWELRCLLLPITLFFFSSELKHLLFPCTF